MKKFFLSFFTIMLSVMFFDISTEVNADAVNYPKVVIGTTADGGIVLSGFHQLNQDDFHRLSGNDFDLQVGDVIRVNCDGETELCYAIYNFDENSSIEYLGNVYELEPENIKTVTLSEITEDYGERIWKDEDGEIYHMWLEERDGSYPVGECEQPVFIDDYEIGDVALCYVSGHERYQCGHGSGYILKKLDTAEDVAEKLDAAPVSIIAGDADGNGEVEMIDMIAVNKYLMIGAPLSDAGIKAADMNGDGEIGQDDGLCILQTVLGLMA